MKIKKNPLVITLIYIELIIMSIFVLLPILFVVGSSFNNLPSLSSASIIPAHPTLKYYQNIFEKTNFGIWYLNTLKIATINMLLSVFLTMPMGYVFSRFRFKGKKVGLVSILVLQIFPSFMGMLALYILFLNFNLLDTHISLILVYSAGQIPFNTYLVKGYIDSIPKSLDESVMIDGGGKFKIFSTVIMPLAVPIITFVAITQFMAPWMDFIFPRLIISSDSKKTLAVGLYELINGNSNNNYTMFAAGAMLVAVPITLLYTYFQRFLIEGITAGAVKE